MNTLRSVRTETALKQVGFEYRGFLPTLFEENFLPVRRLHAASRGDVFIVYQINDSEQIIVLTAFECTDFQHFKDKAMEWLHLMYEDLEEE